MVCLKDAGFTKLLARPAVSADDMELMLLAL